MTGTSFGVGAMIAAGLFLIALIVTGFVARARRQSESLADFYLAGRSLGPLVLLLTLFATQYSGNGFIGYPGEAYRSGFAWVMSVGFMTAVIVVYQLFAPLLHRLSRQREFVTPGDWIDHRFGWRQGCRGARGGIRCAHTQHICAGLQPFRRQPAESDRGA